MKHTILLLILFALMARPSQAQFKEAAQLSTLSPILIVMKSDIERFKKSHYTLSTIGYLGSYMITDSIWKSAAITLGMGIAKELVYDGLLGKGTPLWDDMLWNSLGVTQGIVFTVSLKF
jgi:hypothetical protein